MRLSLSARSFLFPLVLGVVAAAAGCGNPPSDTSSGTTSPKPAPTSGAPAGGGAGAHDVELPKEPDVPKDVIPSKKPDKPLKVGVSLLTRTHQFYKDMEASMQEEAAKQNITLLVQVAEMDGPTQLGQVQTFLSQGVDAIILCPVDSQGAGSMVRLANQQKVPVFTADIASKSGDIVCHVASNNEQGGELIGEYLADQLKGQCEIGIIDFPLVTSVQERVKGFKSAIAKHPGIKIAATVVPEQPKQAMAFPKAQDMLQSHPELKGVFALNDDCALGAIQAANATRRNDFVLVGFDGTVQAIEKMRQGTVLKADAALFPKVIGRAVVDAVAKHAIGEPVPKSVPIPTGLVKVK